MEQMIEEAHRFDYTEKQRCVRMLSIMHQLE
jgi:hypothetical protein